MSTGSAETVQDLVPHLAGGHVFSHKLACIAVQHSFSNAVHVRSMSDAFTRMLKQQSLC